MTGDQAVAFLLFAVVAAATPGPSNVMLVAAGANGGVLRSLPCLLGVAAGMGLMLVIVPFGLGSVVLGKPVALKILNGAGAAVLLWLSWKIASSRRLPTASRARPVGFLGAALFQWVNPKSWLVSASAGGTFLSAHAGSAGAQSLWLGGLFFVAALPSCFPWLAFGAVVQRHLQNERRLRMFNVAMGLLLALSTTVILW
jgi:threonine/homoserine/homoserine lactone efflux protein